MCGGHTEKLALDGGRSHGSVRFCRDSFAYDHQFNMLTRFIIDQTQTPNLKVGCARALSETLTAPPSGTRWVPPPCSLCTFQFSNVITVRPGLRHADQFSLKLHMYLPLCFRLLV